MDPELEALRDRVAALEARVASLEYLNRPVIQEPILTLAPGFTADQMRTLWVELFDRELQRSFPSQ